MTLILENKSFNPYFTGLPILIISVINILAMKFVSILILLDYLFLFWSYSFLSKLSTQFQSLFYWITYSYQSQNFSLRLLYLVSILILLDYLFLLLQIKLTCEKETGGFNPYFTGLPILIIWTNSGGSISTKFQSLFYWITYSYLILKEQWKI